MPILTRPGAPWLVSVCAVIVFSACQRQPPSSAREEITVAAAANLTQVLAALGPQFEAATGIHPVFSFASTAQLTRQIENSAPFDIFAAADAEHVEELDRRKLLLSGSKAVYAVGVLALWIPPGSRAAIKRMEDLTGAGVHTVAVAKPELAPYGQATVEALKSAGIWERVQPKIVYAENISMAKQYGSSKNADAVFTAYSLVQHEGGSVILVDERLHQPIRQELGIVASTKHAGAARRFTSYLLQGAGRELLAGSGYAVP